jgi:polyhydroxybutyrate depolymerase
MSGRLLKTLLHSGREREALVYVPSGYDGRRSLPLVLMFHGASGTARTALQTTGWAEKAERDGFIAVFPEGTRPVPLTHFLGEADPLVPPQGGYVKLPSGLEVEMPLVGDSLERWANLLGCPEKPRLSRPQRGVRLYSCGPCRGGSKLHAYVIEGLGHVWPGGTTLFHEEVVGPSWSPILATDLIWEFFKGVVRGPKGLQALNSRRR